MIDVHDFESFYSLSYEHLKKFINRFIRCIISIFWLSFTAQLFASAATWTSE